jgi:hypothetical protein
MTEREIKSTINSLKSRLTADHYDHEKHRFVPADEETRKWLLSSIETYTKMLPRARYDDDVRCYGWRSVERNA